MSNIIIYIVFGLNEIKPKLICESRSVIFVCVIIFRVYLACIPVFAFCIRSSFQYAYDIYVFTDDDGRETILGGRMLIRRHREDLFL